MHLRLDRNTFSRNTLNQCFHASRHCINGYRCDWGVDTEIFLKDLQSSVSLTYLHLYGFQFPDEMIESDQPLRLQYLRSLVASECYRIPLIFAPALQELRLNDSELGGEHLRSLVKEASRITEICFIMVALELPRLTTGFTKTSLVKLSISTALDVDGALTFYQATLPLLCSCRVETLTTLGLEIPDTRCAMSIPITVFPNLRSLSLCIIYTPSSSKRMQKLAFQILTETEIARTGVLV